MPFKSVADEMHKFKQGKLHSGSAKGPKVTSRKQAIAISLSQARKKGQKVTPMPRDSRPSMAAVTRSGARNASEMVILT